MEEQEHHGLMKRLVAFDQRVLIISDIHFPYAHPDWHPFLKAIKTHFKPELIISIGDEVDGHAISFHDNDSSLPSADEELDKAIGEVHHLRDLFPKMYICESNHGSLIYRRLKHHGIPLRHLKPLEELYETPEWSWHHEILLETHNGHVLLTHGKTSAYGKFARENMCSGIQGHFHGKAEVTWHRTSGGMRFNMFTGCLVDEFSMAMAYGRNNLPKPIISVGWLNELGEPSIIRMQLDKKGRWIGKL